MPAALLDINDCNLQLWHGEAHVQSPGYALLRGETYLFGSDARAAARIQPRNINTRYWWQLGVEALQPALGPARHTADLAHAHLLQLHDEARQPADIVVAVSAGMQREQLSLLLGIAQECPFNPVGLVNRSVALGSLHAGGGDLWHLEIQLHQALLSRLGSAGGTLALDRCLPLPGCGLLQVQERLVETIAAAFVRQTRFDPRRKADTEQALYDALPAALRALRREPESNIEVNGYRARISARDLQAAGQRLFDSARDAMGEARGEILLADPLTALLPGVGEAFPGVVIAGDDDLRNAVQAHGERLVEGGRNLSFVCALPLLGGGEAATPAAAQPESAAAHSSTTAAAHSTPAAGATPPEPTHLLRGGLARPLVAGGTAIAGGCELYRADEGWQLRGHGGSALLNGGPYSAGQLLGAGDRLHIDGNEMTLIEVET